MDLVMSDSNEKIVDNELIDIQFNPYTIDNSDVMKYFFIVKSECNNGFIYYVKSSTQTNKVGLLNPYSRKLFWFDKDHEILCMKHIKEVDATNAHVESIIQLLKTMKTILIDQIDIAIIDHLQSMIQKQT